LLDGARRATRTIDGNDHRRRVRGSFGAQSAIVAQKIFCSGLCGIQPCFAIRWREDPMRAEPRTPRGMS